MTTLGEGLVQTLAAYGVDTVFGIPGVHTIELYRGLAASPIRHVTPRHEQGAGFMADGYARASGRPAAAFVITGPGLTNIATPMAQAYADSVPMLVVSTVNACRALGLEAGDLHEVRRQDLIAAQCAAFSHRLAHVQQLPEALARAWAVFEGARPRPVHIEIPVDMLAEPIGDIPVTRAPALTPPEVAAESAAAAAARLDAAARPVILAGGGARHAAAGIAVLAERLGAPVVMTTNARGILAPDHPLGVPAGPSLTSVRRLLAAADCVIAIGTEIGSTDYDPLGDATPALPEGLVRIEIDPEQMRRGVVPDLPLLGDARAGVDALLARLARPAPAPEGPGRAEAASRAAWDEIGPVYRACHGVLAAIRTALPEAILVGDSTRAIYAGNAFYAAPAPRRWFNAATGYGALGLGLPAAIGAARATGRPAVCLVGDGGLQFTLAELGTAVEERLPVIVLVWNNRGYGEIKRFMQAGQITPVGVDLHSPDFTALARAYALPGQRLERLDDLPRLIAAAPTDGPSLIEIDETLVVPTER